MMNLNVVPQAVADAASSIGNIGTALNEATAVAAMPTSTIIPAGADEVSTAISALFNEHGAVFQELARQAQVFHQAFVQALTGAQTAYQEAESAGARLLQGSFSQRVGVSQDVISLQTGQGLTSSIPFDIGLAVTNSGLPRL
jgi:hypothetical protein